MSPRDSERTRAVSARTELNRALGHRAGHDTQRSKEDLRRAIGLDPVAQNLDAER